MWSGTLIIKNWIWVDKWSDTNYRLHLFLSQPPKWLQISAAHWRIVWKNPAFCSPADLDEAQHFKCIPYFWLHTLNTPTRSIHRQEDGQRFTSSPRWLDHAGALFCNLGSKSERPKRLNSFSYGREPFAPNSKRLPWLTDTVNTFIFFLFAATFLFSF